MTGAKVVVEFRLVLLEGLMSFELHRLNADEIERKENKQTTTNSKQRFHKSAEFVRETHTVQKKQGKTKTSPWIPLCDSCVLCPAGEQNSTKAKAVVSSTQFRFCNVYVAILF